MIIPTIGEGDLEKSADGTEILLTPVVSRILTNSTYFRGCMICARTNPESWSGARSEHFRDVTSG